MNDFIKQYQNLSRYSTELVDKYREDPDSEEPGTPCWPDFEDEATGMMIIDLFLDETARHPLDNPIEHYGASAIRNTLKAICKEWFGDLELPEDARQEMVDYLENAPLFEHEFIKEFIALWDATNESS